MDEVHASTLAMIDDFMLMEGWTGNLTICSRRSDKMAWKCGFTHPGVSRREICSSWEAFW
jgi:hypothetical protein